MEVVLGVDIGTTTTRAIAFSLDGKSVQRASVATAVQYTRGTRAVVDPIALWARVCEVIRGVSSAGLQPVAVGVASQLGILLVDEDLRPTSDAILWPDRRAVVEADAISDELGGTCFTVAGRAVTPESPAAKLLWLRTHCPEVLARSRWVVSVKDYVVARLSRRIVTDPTHASYSLLYDVVRRRWDPNLLEAAQLTAEIMPPVLWGTDAVGPVTEEAAAETGLSRGVTVAVGGPDATLGAVGAGAIQPGVTVNIGGSTDVLLHTVSHPVTDARGQVLLNAYVLPDLWVVGGPTGLTGGAVTWLAQIFRFDSVAEMYAELDSALSVLPRNRHGLVFRTALTGERYPTWEEFHTGAIVGLRPGHQPADLLRAAEEGGAFLVASGLEALRSSGVRVTTVIVVGGVALREATLQLRADVLGCPILTVGEPESTALGAAMVASVAGQQYRTIADAAQAMVRHGTTYEPTIGSQRYLRSTYRAWRLASAVADVRSRATSRVQPEGEPK